MNVWQKKVVDLRGKGLTQTEIAAVMGCSQNYVSDIERGVCGKRLSYTYGSKLEGLWKEHFTGGQQEQLSAQTH
ncbi:helix-turn-helix domain-containing protein [Acinetobacter dispersus]|uniref:helix-turn-helix domain-containing protein n=1 Tax=Acinetobacter dispersus TaxID=70348 RepID=UPI001F4A31D6|nr:helix-turn-helix domain-containing protein [Acinetobacter dispersus]MCH7394214.1 helix-turn-helix domain-containing protein [Acinetobacter dispersus]